MRALTRREQGLLRAGPWGDWWSAGAGSLAFSAEEFARAKLYPTLVAACHRCFVTRVARVSVSYRVGFLISRVSAAIFIALAWAVSMASLFFTPLVSTSTIMLPRMPALAISLA